MSTSNLSVLFSTQRSRVFLLFITMLASLFGGQAAYAQECGNDYVVKYGQSISSIAKRIYGDAQKWSVIYNINIDVIGENPDLIMIGQRLRIPCLTENATTEIAEVAETESAETESVRTEIDTTDTAAANASSTGSISDGKIRFVTGDDYPPFTDRKLINGGLITDLVVSAMTSNPAEPAFEVFWVNEWSEHLTSLLPNHEYDISFPWFQPDCVSTPDEYRCQNYKFSNPIFQMLVLLFVDTSQPIVFNEDADIAGKVLCRPAGYFTHDLEKDGRFWLTQNVIELKQPDTVKECFDMLTDGTVDAVAINEFTGRSSIATLDLEDKVEALENRPLSIENLHVVAHKTNPRAQEMIDTVNESMSELQLSDSYKNIIETHFREFWSTIE